VVAPACVCESQAIESRRKNKLAIDRESHRLTASRCRTSVDYLWTSWVQFCERRDRRKRLGQTSEASHDHLQFTSSEMETLRDTLCSMAESQAGSPQNAFAVKERLAKRESTLATQASEKLDSYGESRKEARIARENEQIDALIELTKSLTEPGPAL
jgi:hypothetical protein